MLTLLVTVLATAYFVVPELISRFVLNWFFVRKTIQVPKSEELMRAAFWAIFPLVIAYATRNHFGCTLPHGSGKAMYEVFRSLYSESAFNNSEAKFMPAVRMAATANLYLLMRVYLVVVLGSLALSVAVLNLGRLRKKRKTTIVGWVSSKVHQLLIPWVSEWHLALSTVLLANAKKYRVEVDVMMKDGTLYRGSVYEKAISKDDTLRTLILSNTQRFLYADYVRERIAYEEKKLPMTAKPDRQKFWRSIPGELFYITGSEIASVNVRHAETVQLIKNDTLRVQLDDLAVKVEEARKRISNEKSAR